MSGCITISYSAREDGGLRIWSDDVPGFVLSGADPSAVWRDLGPALQAILDHNTTGDVKDESESHSR